MGPGLRLTRLPVSLEWHAKVRRALLSSWMSNFGVILAIPTKFSIPPW
eukprot:SAG11_NODE_359_length_10228_cov_7.861388_9_plen_48_part_00